MCGVQEIGFCQCKEHKNVSRHECTQADGKNSKQSKSNCCNNINPDSSLVYSNPQLWYLGANKAGERSFDVFYILPTCVWDRVDAKGDTLYYADPMLDSDRKAMLPSYELADEIFGDSANFYSPYYRQLALQSWRSDSLVNSRFPNAFADIKNAFDYYMAQINCGRPFVLAGFSQGAKCVVELLKTLNSKQYSQLIAAYVIGYRITASDTLNYKQIKPAKGETDAGVAICYNSVADTTALSGSVSSGSAVCINPLNWSISPTPAPLNDTAIVHVDKRCNLLVVSGLNPDKYYLKSLGFMLGRGNYHLQELYFYREKLSENVLVRYNSYRQRLKKVCQ